MKDRPPAHLENDLRFFELRWLASQAQELFVKVSLSDIAGQWRRLANQVEHLEQDRADLKAHPK